MLERPALQNTFSRFRTFRAMPGPVNVRGSILILWGVPLGVQLVVDCQTLLSGRHSAQPSSHMCVCVMNALKLAVLNLA